VFGAAPNDFGWDGVYRATRLTDTSLGQAWIVFANHPLGSILRLGGVAVMGWLLLRLGRDVPSRDLTTEAAAPA